MTPWPINDDACHLELSGLTHPGETCKGCGFYCGVHRKWKHRAKTWPETVVRDGDTVYMGHQCGIVVPVEESPSFRVVMTAHDVWAGDAVSAADAPKIPDDIRATIIDMIDHITQGSTSALFSRVHDVRKWVGER